MNPRFLGVALAALLLGAGPAQADDCVFEKQPQSAGGHFGALTLQSYGTRWEMQIATPDRALTGDAHLLVDGREVPVEIAGGLDDALVTVSDIPGSIDLTEDFLEKLAGGGRVTIRAFSGGARIAANYQLSGSRQAIEFMRENCGN